MWLATALVAMTLGTACDETTVKEATPDSGTVVPDGGSSGSLDGGDAGPSDCFENPTTHFEIINACTNAVKITKNPTLTKLGPDGGLPPPN